MEMQIRTGCTPMMLHLDPIIQMNEEQFFRFCRINDEWRIERTAEGDLEIMPPAGGGTGNRNFKLATRLGVWTERDGTGVEFDSSTGFVLPNGATRSPDASWVRRERLADLSAEQKERFLPLCPDFVVELRSLSDRLENLQYKMREYLENGARLWAGLSTRRSAPSTSTSRARRSALCTTPRRSLTIPYSLASCWTSARYGPRTSEPS